MGVLLGRCRSDKKIIEDACKERNMYKEKLAVAEKKIADLEASIKMNGEHLTGARKQIANLKDESQKFEKQCLEFLTNAVRLAAAWISTAEMSKNLIDTFVKEQEALLESRQHIRDFLKLLNISGRMRND